ncbi:MAG: nucleotidyl transferase AbiEii/AbiGii toxin family protein [Gemmataceae bacterium]|nr:nucleotidyl transferase AbiEii/AbiGii toxin family protein [Gemmataceae bacterium]
MPLTAFQKEVLRAIAKNRKPESHIAGGAAINRAEGGPRFSGDIDIFHDEAVRVAAYADLDAEALTTHGCSVEWKTRSLGFHQARVTKGNDAVRLDWVADSSFRFFPVQIDEEFGFCLHTADLATNKLLAFATRIVARDFIDVLLLDQTYLSLGAIIWAACGKDPGLTPGLLLNLADRHSRFRAEDFEEVILAQPLDLRELKQRWLAAKERAERLIDALPEEELGCLYLDADRNPVTPDPAAPGFASLVRHFGSVRGAWPTIS